jgi:predicted metal-dependent hydrolase
MDGKEPAPSARECLGQGIALFNRGEFFEAHEAMEEAMDLIDDDGDWEFFLGLLRAAVANHKLSQGAVSSAVGHLQASLRYLAPYSDRHHGLKLRELRYALSAQLARLQRDGQPPGAAPQIELT